MTTKKYTTKINYANSNKTTMKSVVPTDIINHLQLSHGDTIKWIITDDGKVEIEKLEL